MKPIFLLLGALTASAVIVGCGPAVGRAVGDTETTNGNTDAVVDVNVDQQLGDFKKEQDEQIQTVTKDFRSEVKETQILFSKQEEEFYTLKNAIDSLETELAMVKEMPKPVAVQPDMGDFKVQVEQNEAFDKELQGLHSRIDSLEETAADIQSMLINLGERAGQIEGTVEYLVSEPQPNIEDDIDMLRMEIEAQLNAVVDHTNSLADVMEQLDTDTRESLAGLSEEITDVRKPAYPILRDQRLAYDNANVWIMEDGPCAGPNNLRECIDDIMGESDISSHISEGLFTSSAHKQMQVSFGDVCKAENAWSDIENALGEIDDITMIENYASLYSTGFLSAEEWDLFKYLNEVHVGYC